MQKKKEATTHSHLIIEERYVIETLLNEKKSIRYIANQLGRSPSTILREIRNHRKKKQARRNDCISLSECNKKNVCGNTDCKIICRSRSCCTRYCPDYQKRVCIRLQQSPYVCNGCTKNFTCTFERYYYMAGYAEKAYRDTLTNTRNGFDLTYEQIVSIDDAVSPLIMKGLSPYHIKQALGTELSISESTLRRLIANNDLQARNIDLRN